MSFNLLKKYSDLLELTSFNEGQRKEALVQIYERDIKYNNKFNFFSKKIQPTPRDDEDKHSILFTHLTTSNDFQKYKREYDNSRSCRLHWIKYHIDSCQLEGNDKLKQKGNVLVFSVKEPKVGIRTYIYDKKESYVIVLEPLRNINEYYLLTAFKVKGKDNKRNKYIKKYKRRLEKLY